VPQQPVVMVTGASSGIGYATGLAFARKGTHVIGTARRVDRLEKLKAEIDALPGEHGEFLPVAADVCDAQDMVQAVQQALDQFGRLDFLIANAGVGHRGAVVESDWQDIETLLRTNIDGVLHSIRAAVPAISQSGDGGHIVLISSVVFNMTSPYFALYAASKAFISNLGNSLRLELEADNIRVTDMLVGRTQSEFSEKRLGQSGRVSSSRIPVMTAEQVANAIVKATEGRRKRIVMRWVDRLIIWGNRLIPNIIGHRAMKQYK
jgi:short-subunit dehydrogenase